MIAENFNGIFDYVNTKQTINYTKNVQECDSLAATKYSKD